jgi:TetR/AcrR family transcriptional repressor of nem operon
MSRFTNTYIQLAFLVTDVAVSEPEVRKTYTQIFKGMNEKMHGLAKSFSNCDESRIYTITAMLIGAVAISRALDKRQIRQALLSGC